MTFLFATFAITGDPCSIVKDADAKYFWRLQNGEVKNGRGKSRLPPTRFFCTLKACVLVMTKPV